MRELLGLFSQVGWVVLYCVVVSTWCALLMFWDKLSATRGWWRVPEAKLLMWAFIGGAVGGKLGQRLYRHKTRKEPFRTWLNRWVVWNAVLYSILLIERLRDAVVTALFLVLSTASAQQS